MPRWGKVPFRFLSARLCSSATTRAHHRHLPDHPPSFEPGNQTPTFPSPRRTLLELALRISGPGASSSPATISSASPATIDRSLQCSSDPVDPASSVARALRCSPTSPAEPTTVGRPPHRCTPPPDRHRHRDRALVSLPPPFTPNRDRRRPGLLPGRFPGDQRLPAGRIWPVSRRRRGEFPLPCFIDHGPKRPRGLGRWAEQAEPAVG
jgi:hypothetical protein